MCAKEMHACMHAMPACNSHLQQLDSHDHWRDCRPCRSANDVALLRSCCRPRSSVEHGRHMGRSTWDHDQWVQVQLCGRLGGTASGRRCGCGVTGAPCSCLRGGGSDSCRATAGQGRAEAQDGRAVGRGHRCWRPRLALSSSDGVAVGRPAGAAQHAAGRQQGRASGQRGGRAAGAVAERLNLQGLLAPSRHRCRAGGGAAVSAGRARCTRGGGPQLLLLLALQGQAPGREGKETGRAASVLGCGHSRRRHCSRLCGQQRRSLKGCGILAHRAAACLQGAGGCDGGEAGVDWQGSRGRHAYTQRRQLLQFLIGRRRGSKGAVTLGVRRRR